MNNWSEIKKQVIFESDDWQDRWDRNGMNFLFYWKSKYPKFKVTLFTIPDRTSKVMLDLIFQHREWVQLAVHGFNHESNFECYSWTYEKTKALMERVEKQKDEYYMKSYYKKIFKSPGWTITGGFNGYPPAEELPIAKDPTGVYRALNDMDYIIIDRHYNKPARPQ